MGFLTEHIDYVIFTSGISLLMFALHAVSLRQVGDRTRQWLWLAVAGFSLSFASVPELLRATGVRLAAVGLTEHLLTAVAAGALCEVWVTYSAHGQARPRRGWWHAGVWLAVALATLVSLVWPTVHLPSVLLVVGAALAWRVLHSVSGRIGSVSRKGGVGAALLAFAVLNAIVVYLSAGSGYGETALWLALARTVVAALAMFLLGGVVAQRVSENLPEGAVDSQRRVRVLLGLLLVVTLVSGFIVTERLCRLGEESVISGLQRRADSIAAAIDGEDVAVLDGRSIDVVKPEYEMVERQLTNVLAANPDASYLYIMRRIGGRVVILADGRPTNGGAGEPPGTAYPDATERLVAAFASPVAFNEGPYQDSYGTWYSAFAPIYDSTTGEFVGLLGMDLNSSVMDEATAAARRSGLALALAACALAIGFYIVLQMTRGNTARVAASEGRFRTMFENAPEAIMVLDAEGHQIVDANPFLLHWLGYEDGGLLSMSLEDIVVEGGPAIRDCLANAAATGNPHTQSCAYRKRGGQIVDVEATALFIVYGGIPSVLVFAHDVTRQRAAERAITSQAEFNALITDVSRSFINAKPATIDAEIERALGRIGRYVGVDRSYVFTFEGADWMENTHEWVDDGVPSRRVAMRHTPIVSYPWLTTRLKGLLDVYLPDTKSAPDIGDEERRRLEAAGVRSLLAVPMVVGGQAVGFLGFDSLRTPKRWEADAISVLRIVGDIIASARQRMDSQAKVRKLSRAVEQSPVAVVITDADGAIEYVNRKFTELTQYSAEEALGQNPRLLKSDNTPASTYEELWETVLHGREWQGEMVNRKKDGTTYWAQLTVTAMRGSDGSIAHFVGVQQDISAAKQSAEVLREATERAESANRAKSEFLATMSHEIRTPMNAIIGMAELLQDTELTRQQARYVDIFERAGESLLSLINSVLDLSKIEAERLDLERVPFDLTETVESAAAVLSMRVAEKNLELLYRMAPGTPTNVVGDPERLRQVLMNLLGNAVKFTEKGQILLSVALDPDRAGPGMLRFSVADTGIGISHEKLTTIFESFTQADSSTTRKYGGTGLGLTISRRLVELMGGVMWVESEPGQGATFSFAVPFALAEEAQEQAPSPTAETLGGLRALVVDDNDTNRLIVHEMLTGWDVTVGEAPSGLDGLAELQRASADQPYDVIVLDHQMPEMDGYEFLEHLRADDRLKHTPVVMLSSDARANDISRVRSLGISDYLLKPVRRADLREALAAAVEAPAHVATPHSVDAVASNVRPMHVLLVEDSEDNRFLIESYLSKTPHRVEAAMNGQEAVEAFCAATEPFDLVLMDMQMPVMDGYEATRVIREWEGTNHMGHTPILALTAYALKEEVDRSIDAGCDAHLTKPIKKKALLVAVSSYAEGDEDGR